MKNKTATNKGILVWLVLFAAISLGAPAFAQAQVVYTSSVQSQLISLLIKLQMLQEELKEAQKEEAARGDVINDTQEVTDDTTSEPDNDGNLTFKCKTNWKFNADGSIKPECQK